MNDIKKFESYKSNKKKVFLGGTCNDSTWRNDVIKKLKIDYFNPVVTDWNEEAKEREIKERETADFVLYVITPRMKGVYSIAEVVDDSNKRPDKTIFCYLKEDKKLKSEIEKDGDDTIKFDKFQLNSLNEVGNMVERNGGNYLKNLDEVIEFLNKK